MKTTDIMNVFVYDALAGDMQAIPVQDVIAFLNRIQNRLDDIQDGMPISTFSEEIKQVITKLENQ